MTYNFSPTQNNGRIVSSVDAVTGENVSYSYDSLNRLIASSTAGTAGVQWGYSHGFDGFGNLSAKVATKGSAQTVYLNVDSTTNQVRINGDIGYDANGNWMGMVVATCSRGTQSPAKGCRLPNRRGYLHLLVSRAIDCSVVQYACPPLRSRSRPVAAAIDCRPQVLNSRQT
jgi:YD repeat-containing protein